MSRKEQFIQNPIMIGWLVVPFLVIVLTTRIIVQSKMVFPSLSEQQFTGEVITNSSLPDIELQGKGVLTLWFDDAWKSHYDTVFPELESRNLTAALAVPTQLIGYEAYMNWEDVRTVGEAGWEITAHSRTHTCAIENFSFDKLNFEIEGSKIDLKKHGFETDIYVAPCGTITSESNSLVLYHFQKQRLVEPGFNTFPIENPYHLKVQVIRRRTSVEEIATWVETAQKDNSWLILTFHQVDHGGDQYSTTPETLKKMLDEIKLSGIQIALPTQVLRHSS